MSNCEQLMAMGFSQEAANTALQMNNNNFDNALSLLLNQATMVQNPTIGSSSSPPINSNNGNSFNNKNKTPSMVPNSMLESLAQGLSSDRPALDAIDKILQKLLKNPSDQTVTVLQLGGSLAPIKSSEIAINFLKELGYQSKSGFLILKSSPNNLNLAYEYISQAKGNEDYRISSLLESTRLSAIEDARQQRNLLKLKPLRKEPDVSSTFTRLVFHFNEDGEPERKIERRFEPDECLYDMIHYLGTLDEDMLDAHSWELIEQSTSSSSLFWWCHGWEISDITLRPPRPLTKEDATKTLQGLGLWPSAQIRIKVSSLAPVPTRNNQSGQSQPTASSSSQGGDHYLRSRPTPQQIMKQATSRFESIPLNKKEHANVNRSAASTRAAAAEARMQTSQQNKPKSLPPPPTYASTSSNNINTMNNGDNVVAELVAMGFPEDKVRNALSSSGGDQARAVEILLR